MRIVALSKGTKNRFKQRKCDRQLNDAMAGGEENRPAPSQEHASFASHVLEDYLNRPRADFKLPNKVIRQ
jgi:hypothetical protein